LIREQRHKAGLKTEKDELEYLLGSAQDVPKLGFHRAPMDAAKVEALVANGEALANVPRARDYGRAISALRAKVRGVTSVLAVRERELKRRVSEQLDELAAQKAEIVEQEESVKASLQAGLDKYQRSAKIAVTRAIREASPTRFNTGTEGNDIGPDDSEVSVIFEDE
jgi:Sec-independent protein translocase protein TatA